MDFSEGQYKTSNQRREENNIKIKNMGITCFEKLPAIEDSKTANFKSVDDLGKKAIATLLTIQLASDALNSLFDESKPYFEKLINSFDVSSYLDDKEKRIFSGDYTRQNLLDESWLYEAYWSLVWALGLTNDMSPSSICDVRTAINFVNKYDDYESFKKSFRPRDKEEILDMLDLYYRLNWAITEKRLSPDTQIGNLDPEVVIERRRGLEWIISEEFNWDDISLDT